MMYHGEIESNHADKEFNWVHKNNGYLCFKCSYLRWFDNER